MPLSLLGDDDGSFNFKATVVTELSPTTTTGIFDFISDLGADAGVLAFIPNIGAITSGVLMVAVGFSAGPHQGVYAIFVYFFVQNIDGYLVVPYIARRTVDLAPAIVLAMQLLMGALFGILGVLFADPILATLKVMLVDVSNQQAAREGEDPEVVDA